MGLGLVDHVVPPSNRLLDAEHTPLILFHQAVAGNEAGKLLGEDHMAVLVLSVEVLVAVQDLGLHLGDELLGALLLGGVSDREVIDAVRSRGDGSHFFVWTRL